MYELIKSLAAGYKCCGKRLLNFSFPTPASTNTTKIIITASNSEVMQIRHMVINLLDSFCHN